MQRAFAIFLVSLFLLGCNKPDKYLLVSKIRAGAKIATTEVVVSKIVHFDQKAARWKSILLKDDGTHFIFNSEATVQYGVDLNKITARDIKVFRDSVVVFLPAPEMINFSYPFELLEEIPVFENDVNKIKPKELDEALVNAEAEIREQLKFMEIEEKVRINTVRVVTDLFKLSSQYNLSVRFKGEKKVNYARPENATSTTTSQATTTNEAN